MEAVIERANLADELEESENFKEENMDIKDYEHTIGLKIQERAINAQGIMFLKNETKLSISELKKRLDNGDYILKYGLGDSKGLQHINGLKKALKDKGLTVKLYEDDKEVESYIFDNLEEMDREICHQVGLTDDDIDYLY